MPADLLLEEYKLLQAKLDKIGAFRFQIKGWAVTIILGYTVAALTYKVSFLGMLPAALIVIAFQLTEHNQDMWARAFKARLGLLESAMRRGPRGALRAPGVVRAIGRRNSQLRRRRRNWLGLHAHGVFYVVLYTTIGLVALQLALNSPAGQATSRIELANPVRISVLGKDLVTISPTGVRSDSVSKRPRILNQPDGFSDTTRFQRETPGNQEGRDKQ